MSASPPRCFETKYDEKTIVEKARSSLKLLTNENTLDNPFLCDLQWPKFTKWT